MNFALFMIPLFVLAFAGMLFLQKKIILEYIGENNFQVILIFTVTLFTLSILGFILVLLELWVFLFIWVLVVASLIGFIYYSFKKLHQELKTKDSDLK